MMKGTLGASPPRRRWACGPKCQRLEGGAHGPVSSLPPPVNTEKGTNSGAPKLTMTQEVLAMFEESGEFLSS